MKNTENLLPRLVAAVVAIVSLAMFIPLIRAARTLVRDGTAPMPLWLAPLLLLATGALLTHVLTRRSASAQLVVAAFALWLVTAGYFLTRIAF
jgi:hypothetical protein